MTMAMSSEAWLAFFAGFVAVYAVAFCVPVALLGWGLIRAQQGPRARSWVYAGGIWLALVLPPGAALAIAELRAFWILSFPAGWALAAATLAAIAVAESLRSRPVGAGQTRT